MADKLTAVRPFVNEVVHFFRKQVTELALQPDLVESLEVAVQCLEAVYSLPSAELDTQTDRVDVYELYEGSRSVLSEEKVAESESLKNEGNRLMKEEKYVEAIQQYTRAINIDPRNPIFYCNRAAAWIRLGDHEQAISDSNLSLRYNPRYSKAFVRLGDAYFRMENFKEAADAYQKAIAIEPDNEDYKNKSTMAMQRNLAKLQSSAGPPNTQTDNLFNVMQQLVGNPQFQAFLPQMQAAVSGVGLDNISSQMRNMMQNPEILNQLTSNLMETLGSPSQQPPSADPNSNNDGSNPPTF